MDALKDMICWMEMSARKSARKMRKELEDIVNAKLAFNGSTENVMSVLKIVTMMFQLRAVNANSDTLGLKENA